MLSNPSLLFLLIIIIVSLKQKEPLWRHIFKFAKVLQLRLLQGYSLFDLGLRVNQAANVILDIVKVILH